ncbi:CarD family transcriptional regulator [Candidatus Magnetomorum sp. HK-1]|nr:CarD family transcriptional regulator [Candidatus Magnetomorum sp. HK-1]
MQEKDNTEKNFIPTPEEPIRQFEVGDLAVYPAHGVGRIEAIESREISGGIQNFYIMKILENSMVIMIPVQNVESVGLRDILSENDVPKVYDIMKDRDIPQDNQTWNRRYRDYMEKIKTGSLFEVAGVYRDLFLLRLTKELSFGERKLLDTAQCLLVKELSIARQSEEDIILNEINALFEPAVRESEARKAEKNQPEEPDPPKESVDNENDDAEK